ncbi:hypothetical protein ABT023_16165 [Micromonospora sp. NPDC002296]
MTRHPSRVHRGSAGDVNTGRVIAVALALALLAGLLAAALGTAAR